MASRRQSEEANTRLRRARAIGLGSAGALALILGVVFALQLRGPSQPELPTHGEMPAFELVTQDSEPIATEDLRGQPLIANTIFTRCPTVCPVFTAKMKRLQERTEELGSELELLSFSVDPEYDTPERLAAYAEDHGADPERWTFVTGATEEIERTLREGLHVAMDPQGELPDGTPDIIHSTHFVLFDDSLKVRGYYDANDAERLDALVRDARHLAETP